MRIPIATYRLQFNPDFGFQEAKQIASYLDALGISDIYASPIFKARSGSRHGYDVVDQNQLNPELGDRGEFDALISDLHERGMGWLQDIVPNHMAYDGQNQYLMDVLEHGPHSQYFDYFDIEWEHSDDIQGKLLAPMLGDFYDRCLERGEIQISYDKDGLKVNYYALQFPLRIESYAQFLTHDLHWLRRRLGRQHPDYIKLLGILYLLKDTFPEMALQQRKDQSAFVKQMLWELYQDNQEVKAFIDQNIETFNGQPGKPGSFTLLDSLLLEQFYRLSFWKVGAEELNYRRFFTVNELICLKIDSPKVLKNTHKLIFQLVDSGAFDGLRIDHIDGLYDPTVYLKRLRERKEDLYIVIEKILEFNEELPSYWPVQGTSGYEFLNYVNGVFCQQQNRKPFSQFYRRFSGVTTPYEQLFLEKKQLIADTNLVGDIDNLARFLKKVASQYRYGRDLTASGLKTAIQEVLVTFPIYCTYINQRGVAQRDLKYIRTAIQAARKRIPQLLNELNLIERFLLLEYEDSLPEDERAEWLHFVMRLQQFTGPLMAKGVEDTLFYVYNRFISLNEVGGSPEHFGLSLMDFHEYNQRQYENWPYTLNATSTHDTKRSEDVRARLNAISELPAEWRSQVKTWSELNQPHKQSLSGHLVPDPNDEYFLYQTLVGAFPFDPGELDSFKQRVKDYVVKAVREAKVYTAWLRPDTEYEEGFVNFVEALLTPSPENPFLEQLQSFQQKIADYGIYNALSQTLIKMTAPGIPDFYQGTEMWDLSLVDPDNRRPVDYDRRLTALKSIQKDWQTDKEKLMKELLSRRTDGRIKLFLTMRGLALRNQFRQVLQNGSYAPIKTVGKHADNLIAFARHKGERTIVAIAPRFLTELIQPGEYPLGAKIWNDTQIELPGGAEASWCEWITDRTIAADNVISVGEVLRHFPVALLVSENHPVDL
ncbi:malto-oligosyltrehalose synthase [Romeria aff. gracilis LEGE 07310]|uniref:Malto-oligosyltrehalose synthase n=1 Tax=Vasconcelosia minhoensis LEGE 07310 TaxID=915328 RepID=A0A8J7DMY2_9CYAN|nr:malto-oligosyltrehalose synthase [Romeria gracilis]MBE9077435.1 malto-oligosyltrehalose synthase [Romeria aff. gracilis LEGE 07310]